MLAVGALVLLLFGAWRGEAADGPMSELAIGVLGLALIVVLLCQIGRMASSSTAPSSTTRFGAS